MKQTLILTTTALALVLMLSGCSDETTSSQTPDEHAELSTRSDNHAENEEGGRDIVALSPDASREAGIEVSQAAKGPMGQFLSLPAEIRFDADRVANVSPKVSGIIGRLYVGEGDLVKRGQTLALISSRELAGLKASWLNAKTSEALAAQKLAREEKLFSDRITAEADVQAARANFEVLRAASDAAENELHAAGVSDEALSRVAGADDGDNANSYLTAPISGMIVSRNVTLGETVSAGDASARALFTIVDDSEVWADIAVYKQDISSIRVGAVVLLKTDSGEILAQSTVAFVLPVIDETSRTATARVIIKNPNGKFRPGQFVTAEISAGPSTSVIRVPESAVQLVRDKAAIFVPVDGGYAVRAVLIGEKSGGFVEIQAGLSVGETFVSGGAFTLKAQLEKADFGDGHGH